MAPLYSFISIELSVAGLLKLERGISKVDHAPSFKTI